MDIVSEIRRLAAKSPGNKYHRTMAVCLYSKGSCSDGSCGCIIGQALSALGHDTTLLDKGDHAPAANEAVKHFIPDCRELVLDWCCIVQAQQDCGEAWGTAVLKADELYPLADTIAEKVV